MEKVFIGKIHTHNTDLCKDIKYFWLTLMDTEEKNKMDNMIKTYNHGVIKYSFSYYNDYPNMKLKITVNKKNKEHNIYRYSSIDLINLPFSEWYKYDLKITAKVNKRSFKVFKHGETEINNIVFFTLKKIELIKY